MRSSRRDILRLGLTAGAATFAAQPAAARAVRPTPVEITATPIVAFSPSEPGRARFGALLFRGGLRLHCRHDDFGGWSGLWRSADGRELVAIGDKASWLTAQVASEDGRLAGLSGARIAPVLGARGQALWRGRSYDTESLAIAEGVAYVGVERTHEVLRFDWARSGPVALGRPVALPPEAGRLPRNAGLEAIGFAPAGSPVAGAVVAIAERSTRGDETPTLGLILGGPRPGLFQMSRRGGYDVTDLAFLPGGDMLVLERWFKPLRGLGLRIRRVAGRDLRPGALLDGPVLIEADLGQEIDNMEGLAVHQEGGRTILTLISDDNFSLLQRTLLLEFELAAG